MKKKILKIGVPILVIIALIIAGLFIFKKDDPAVVILDNSDNSYFVDFYTEEDKVYFECVLNIYADRDTEVSISATDTDNVKMGLLDSPELTGIDKSDNDKTFALKAGENKVTVLFEGKYAGIPQIFAREIPRFIEVKAK